VIRAQDEARQLPEIVVAADCCHDASMATLTIRNVPEEVAEARNGRSMEEQVRRLLEEQLFDRRSALVQIEAMVARQNRPTSREEVDRAIEGGRT
jgi:plasmid stability protein